jgi:DNA-directed RNA polymerase subunit K/omega
MSKKLMKKKVSKEESDDEISETIDENDDIIEEEDTFEENNEFEEDGYNEIEELEEPDMINECILDKTMDEELYDIDDNDNSEIETVLEEKLLKGNERISVNRLTKYEMVRILGERTKQLTMGAKPLIKNYEGLNYDKIAEEELKLNMIPYKIKRTLPNGKYEIWTLDELFKDHLITLLE